MAGRHARSCGCRRRDGAIHDLPVVQRIGSGRTVRSRIAVVQVLESQMKNLVLLSVLVSGCALGNVTVSPYEAAAAHAHAMAMRNGGPVPVTPSLRCGGTKKIVHGDGHVTPCPGCVDCQAKESAVEAIDLIQPAVYTRLTKVAKQQCADGSCTAGATECECTAAGGACACSPRAKPTSGSCSIGSCASGSCGGSSAQSARGPLRRVGGFFRERRPVRRLFGRLFGRR